MTGSRDTEQALIGFDMGGTSTDVSRFANGKYEHVVDLWREFKIVYDLMCNFKIFIENS